MHKHNWDIDSIPVKYQPNEIFAKCQCGVKLTRLEIVEALNGGLNMAHTGPNHNTTQTTLDAVHHFLIAVIEPLRDHRDGKILLTRLESLLHDIVRLRMNEVSDQGKPLEYQLVLRELKRLESREATQRQFDRTFPVTKEVDKPSRKIGTVEPRYHDDKTLPQDELVEKLAFIRGALQKYGDANDALTKYLMEQTGIKFIREVDSEEKSEHPLADIIWALGDVKWKTAVAIENLFRGPDALEAALEVAKPKFPPSKTESKGGDG